MFTALLPVSLLLLLLSSCSAGGFGVVPCPLVFFFLLGRTSLHELPHASRRGRCGFQAWRSKKGHLVPSRGHPRDRHPHSPPLLVADSVRGPVMRTWGGMSVRFCLNISCSEVKDKKRVCLRVYAYLCAYSGVCVSVCVCVLEWNDQGRAEAVKLIVYEVNSTRCPVLPRPPLLSSSGATVWAAARPLRSGSIWTAACLWQNPSSRTASGLICWWFPSPIQPGGEKKHNHVSTMLYTWAGDWFLIGLLLSQIPWTVCGC